MRSILNFVVLLTGVAFFTACEKVEDLPNYNVGNPVILITISNKYRFSGCGL